MTPTLKPPPGAAVTSLPGGGVALALPFGYRAPLAFLLSQLGFAVALVLWIAPGELGFLMVLGMLVPIYFLVAALLGSTRLRVTAGTLTRRFGPLPLPGLEAPLTLELTAEDRLGTELVRESAPRHRGKSEVAVPHVQLTRPGGAVTTVYRAGTPSEATWVAHHLARAAAGQR